MPGPSVLNKSAAPTDDPIWKCTCVAPTGAAHTNVFSELDRFDPGVGVSMEAGIGAETVRLAMILLLALPFGVIRIG